MCTAAMNLPDHTMRSGVSGAERRENSLHSSSINHHGVSNSNPRQKQEQMRTRTQWPRSCPSSEEEDDWVDGESAVTVLSFTFWNTRSPLNIIIISISIGNLKLSMRPTGKGSSRDDEQDESSDSWTADRRRKDDATSQDR